MLMARYIKVIVCLLAATTALMVATAGAAAASPVTFTDVSTFSDSFSGPLDCQGELYTFTITARTIVHYTFFEQTGAFHLHVIDHGKGVAVPLDGTGPSYTSNFFDFDLENIRAVKHGDALVEEDTDLFRTVAHGSDGSRSFFYLHRHFTMNASGETTVQFKMHRVVCA